MAVISVGVCLLPSFLILLLHGAGLASLLLLVFVTPFFFFAYIAPLVLAGVWALGYRAWIARTKDSGQSPNWTRERVAVYLGLAIITGYVLTFSGMSAVAALLGR